MSSTIYNRLRNKSTDSRKPAASAGMLHRRYCRLSLTLLAMLAFALAQTSPAALGQDRLPDNPVVFAPVFTPSGELLTAQNVSVTMRDGTTIALDIYRPDDTARHPALYAAGPYPLNMSVLEDTSSETGPVAWYVSQGYAVVLANVRGTGASGGEFTFMAREEQQDHYEVIQWITEQPWSDGQVAGTGAGYYAVSQWYMALQNPPGLACIAPVNGTLDPLREWVMPGGLASNAFIYDWYEQRVRLANAYAPDTPRTITFDMRLAQLLHPISDAWWEDRNILDNIRLVTVPVFVLHDWSQAPADPGLTSTLNALAQLNGVNKALLGNPSGNLPLYQDTALLARELLPYYSWCFNGRNPSSPFIERARVRYQVRGQDAAIRRESNWPPGNIAQQAWFLDNPAVPGAMGRLVSSQGAGGPGFSNVERNSTDNTLRFVTEPLEQDLSIAGPIMLELYGASTTGDMAFNVALKEEMAFSAPAIGSRLPEFLGEEESPALQQPGAGTGTEVLVSRGRLKASSRLRDNRYSSEFSPVYAMIGREALSPGQVYRQDIALRQTAYRFRAGNRLVLEISPANDGSLAGTARDTLYHSVRYPTRLWLPVVQAPQVPDGRQRALPGNRQTGPAAPDQDGNAQQSPEFFVPR